MDALILSYALDTNGGNARMVQAARRFGNSKAVIKALAIGNQDPAGVVGRFQEAAEKDDILTIRSAHRTSSYLDFPGDIMWVLGNRKSEAEIRALIAQSDVVHLNNSEMAAKRFRIRKPMLLHHHGTLFRTNPQRMLDVAAHSRMAQAVSTMDLTRPDPENLHWLPSPYDIDDLQRFAAKHRRDPDGRVRIVHCPTNRLGKHTHVLAAALGIRLPENTVARHQPWVGIELMPATTMPNVDLLLVQGQNWRDTAIAKATGDILFDQLAFGYGCNSIEAWGMGIPVISGADPWTLLKMEHDWPAIPFEVANPETLKDVIRSMVLSKDQRDEAAGRGMAHVRKYHDEKPALMRLLELYQMAIAKHSVQRIPTKAPAVTFRSSGRTVYLDEEPIPFTDGVHESTDPLVIARLRSLSKRKAFGISEVA